MEVSRKSLDRLPRAQTLVGQTERVLREAIAAHPPSSPSRKRLRIKFATQAEINPPTFVFFANDASLIHFSYKRYLENALRKRFGFEGTAIKLVFRSRSE